MSKQLTTVPVHQNPEAFQSIFLLSSRKTKVLVFIALGIFFSPTVCGQSAGDLHNDNDVTDLRLPRVTARASLPDGRSYKIDQHLARLEDKLSVISRQVDHLSAAVSAEQAGFSHSARVTTAVVLALSLVGLGWMWLAPYGAFRRVGEKHNGKPYGGRGEPEGGMPLDQKLLMTAELAPKGFVNSPGSARACGTSHSTPPYPVKKASEHKEIVLPAHSVIPVEGEIPRRPNGASPESEGEYLNLVDTTRAHSGSPKNGATESAREPENYADQVTIRLVEAEFLLLLKKHNEAERLISSLLQTLDDEKPDLRPWYMAFRIHRETGNRSAFEESVQRFCTRYNALPPSWSDAESPEVSLEDCYPHIVGYICVVWDSLLATPFLNGLLLDNRSGKRRGLELSVIEDIRFLRDISLKISDELP